MPQPQSLRLSDCSARLTPVGSHCSLPDCCSASDLCHCSPVLCTAALLFSQGVVVVRFNRPSSFNAMTVQMGEQFQAAMAQLGQDKEVARSTGCMGQHAEGMDHCMFAMTDALALACSVDRALCRLLQVRVVILTGEDSLDRSTPSHPLIDADMTVPSSLRPLGDRGCDATGGLGLDSW